MNFRWITHNTTSSLHIAHALCTQQRLVDNTLAHCLTQPAQELHAEMALHNLPHDIYWKQLLSMAHMFDNKRQLAQITLYRALGMTKVREELLASLVGRLQHVQQQFEAAFPDNLEQLALRVRPLKEQWEARGPGLLKIASGLFTEQLLVPGVDVLLVPPVMGGYGIAQLYNNTVRMEGLLANPHAQLPEVVRLAWLVLQLNLDLPMFTENIFAPRVPMIASLAMLPVALHAAEQVELVKFEPSTLELALQAWHVPVPDKVNIVPLLFSWWNVLHNTNTSVPIALQALDAMLRDEANSIESEA